MATPAPTSRFPGLSPAAVWHHFATLCAIPRPSKAEGAVRDAVEAWARGRGLATRLDAVGNLLIRKPAHPGREGAPTVAIQGHLDMVTQKNGDSAHDFTRDPIRTEVQDGWVVAPETTLGADNGLGVAMALAALEDDTLAHGPLEVLLTIDEESGMSGAHGLEPQALEARLMLNLDTEEWGEFYLGCAGGVDVDASESFQPEPVPAGHVVLAITVRGLRGGHSGINIHEGRGNAIRALVGVLGALGNGVRLASFDGGTARNAIPREATAVVVLPAAAAEGLKDRLAAEQARLRRALDAEPGLELVGVPATAAALLPAGAAQRWMEALGTAPFGVARMSADVPGVVETSNNLGVVRLSAEKGHANLMVRSLVDAEFLRLGKSIAAHFESRGIGARLSGEYPGWKPNPSSKLLALCQKAYTDTFHADSHVQVIHAGLECGIIGAKYPGLDTVSFGPTIRGAHAPGERVEIESVGRCYQLLRTILERV
ncbi:MAG: beta-Ala-His dipeptidase [Deltaproteobacteria bacterium]|nr:beta-Ala-His dipeptidase [Deltaproteobacteria bacterium]